MATVTVVPLATTVVAVAALAQDPLTMASNSLMLVGRVSTKFTFDSAGLFAGLLIVKVSVVLVPLLIGETKALSKVGVNTFTVRQLLSMPMVLTLLELVILAALLVKLAFGQVPV